MVYDSGYINQEEVQIQSDLPGSLETGRMTANLIVLVVNTRSLVVQSR